MTTLSLKVRPRWWDRERVLGYLTMLENLVMFKELGYSIAPPRYGLYGDRKEAGFNIVFKNKRDKKEFFELGLTQHLMTKLEEICRDRLVIKADYHKAIEG
jgi:hypothetical protein